MKTLRPQHLTARDTSDIERQLKLIFWKIIFEPIIQVIANFTQHPTLENTFGDAIREAIRTGRIQYHDGVFSGELSAAIARELRTFGAKFDKRSKVYRQDVGSVPPWVRAEAAGYATRARECHTFLEKKLNDIQADLNHAVDVYTVEPEETLDRIEKGFQVAARTVAVMPELSTHSKENLAAAYTENMKLWIKNWSAESIENLRGKVQANAQQGYRFASLTAGIKQQYGVSQSKARFLASQETRLFMAGYRKERFTAAGIGRYKWSTAHDVRVRHDHKDLDGRVFAYNDPPIVDKATGKRGSPGTDFGCRCLDIPIVGRALVEAA